MSLKKNFLYNSAYQILTLILPVVTAPYLSRVLGSDGVGTYSYTYSIAYYFVMFAMLGVNNYGNRSIAQSRNDSEHLSQTFWSIWALQGILGLCAVLIYVAYALLISRESIYALIWVPYVLTAILDINWFYFGLEKFKFTVTRNFIIKLITFVLTFVVVRGEHALVAYLALMSASMFISVVVLWPFLRTEVNRYVPSLKEIVVHIKPNLVLFVPVIAVSLYTVMDKVMLGQISGMSETGIFENSYKVGQMPVTLITALGTVMLPNATNLIASGREAESIKRMGPSMWFAMLLSSAFTFGLFAITPEFVPIFFGDGYGRCGIVLPLIAFDMPFMSWANVIRTQYLIPKQRDKDYVFSILLGAASNVTVNLLLIPTLGAIGAGIGTLVAEAVVCIVQTIEVSNDLPLRQWYKETAPGAIIGLLMFICVRMISRLLDISVAGLLIEILIGILSFTVFAAIWYLGTNNDYLYSYVLPTLRRIMKKQ